MVTPVLKAWAFKTIKKSELRYQGNNGYDDNPTKSYSYDNLVANHKQVKEGDIVIVYNRSEILGVTKIDFISSKETTKEINNCTITNCNADRIRKRNKKNQNGDVVTDMNSQKPKLNTFQLRSFRHFSLNHLLN